MNENVLKVDSFLTHQVDSKLMIEIAKTFADKFRGVNKVLTIESSGIAPAILTAHLLDVPMVFARKHKSLTLNSELISTKVFSYTKQTESTVSISNKFLKNNDIVLIIDDFLANGEAAKGLINICTQVGAKVAGIGIVIEKSFQPGRQLLENMGVEVFSLARIKRLEKGVIEFVDEKH